VAEYLLGDPRLRRNGSNIIGGRRLRVTEKHGRKESSKKLLFTTAVGKDRTIILKNRIGTRLSQRFVDVLLVNRTQKLSSCHLDDPLQGPAQTHKNPHQNQLLIAHLHQVLIWCPGRARPYKTIWHIFARHICARPYKTIWHIFCSSHQWTSILEQAHHIAIDIEKCQKVALVRECGWRWL
jgi:hypothetical protein